MGRAPCCQKLGLNRGRWTAEEDQILINFIRDNGEGSWRSLPKNAGLLRCGKSCRLRWINYLRTDLKRGNISPQEDDLIIKLHATLGNRWSLIASQLPGRTDNEIKNYWNSHLRRSIFTWRRPMNDSSLPQNVLDNLARLMVKHNPSTKTKNKKTDAPNIDESSKSSTTTHEEHIEHDAAAAADDNINDKPQRIFSLEDLREVGDQEKEHESCMDSRSVLTNDDLIRFMNDFLTDIDINHANTETATNQTSSYHHTFDQLINMFNDRNWDDYMNHDDLGSLMSWLLDGDDP